MSDPDRSRRAAAARAAILASGRPELIERLHLLDAAAAPPAGRAAGPSAAGTAVAAGAGALGGVLLGTVLGGLVLDAQMRAAFAALAEDAGFDPGAVAAALADLPGAEAPFDASVAADDGFGDGFDDLGLGDLFDI